VATLTVARADKVRVDDVFCITMDKQRIYVGTGYGISIWMLHSWQFVGHLCSNGAVHKIFLTEGDRILAQVSSNVQWWDFSSKDANQREVLVLVDGKDTNQRTSLRKIFDFCSGENNGCSKELLSSRKLLEHKDNRVFCVHLQSRTIKDDSYIIA